MVPSEVVMVPGHERRPPGVDRRLGSDDGARLDHHVGSDVRVGGDLRVRRHDGARVDARGGTLLLAREEAHGLEVGQIGVGILDQGLADVPMVLGDDDGGSLRQLEVGLVAWIGEEGEIPFLGLPDSGDAGDLDGSIADDRSVDRPCDRLQRDLHRGLLLNRFAHPAPGYF